MIASSIRKNRVGQGPARSPESEQAAMAAIDKARIEIRGFGLACFTD
jgi:hypothetical protein